jgi:hypothetical protein
VKVVACSNEDAVLIQGAVSMFKIEALISILIEELSKFSPSIEGLVQIQDVNLII